MRAAYLEVLADLVGSVGVIIAALLIAITGEDWIDPVFAIALGVWIVPRTLRLAAAALRVLLQAAPAHIDLRDLQSDLAALPGVVLDPATVETNLVFFELTGPIDAPTLVERLLARGVRMGAMGPHTVRAVTHLDVSATQIERTLDAARAVLA